MEYKILKYLYDVDNAILEIEQIQEHVANESPTIDLMRIRALERNFEIIGEAINRILKEDQSYKAKITSSRTIVDLRNFIIHS
ncbi:MAG: HepT-like ribonuclease domain-containing protein [Nonlabens sp.]